MKLPDISLRVELNPKLTFVVLSGTLFLTLMLLLTLVIRDYVTQEWFKVRIYVLLGIILYLLLGAYLLRIRKIMTVNVMILLLYISLAFLTLINWGLNAPVGILITGFIVFLPGVLMGLRFIMPVTVLTIIVLCSVHIIHTYGISAPRVEELAEASSFWDLIGYTVLLSSFALVS